MSITNSIPLTTHFSKIELQFSPLNGGNKGSAQNIIPRRCDPVRKILIKSLNMKNNTWLNKYLK